MKRILVTGASGGLAGPIIENLLDKGYTVIATARSEEKIKQASYFSKITFVPYDLSDNSDLNLFNYFNCPDAIIHLAWDKLSEYKSEVHVNVILNQHKVFLMNLIRHGLNTICCAGTCYEYGLRPGCLKETDEPAPIIAYAIAKNSLRLFLEEQQAHLNFNLAWVRIFNVFSPGKGGSNLFSQLVKAIVNKEPEFKMSGGEQIRDYLSPEEVADIMVKITCNASNPGIVNCCSGKPIKLKDLIDQYLKKNNYHIRLNLGFYPYLSHEPMELWGSTEKLNSILKSVIE